MRRQTDHQLMARIIKEAGRCELCGSQRGLEAHHIIPVVCGGEDSVDNLICVCSACHAKLTPKSLLTKIGMRNVEQSNARCNFKIELYELIQKKEEEYGAADTALIFDAIDEL